MDPRPRLEQLVARLRSRFEVGDTTDDRALVNWAVWLSEAPLRMKQEIRAGFFKGIGLSLDPLTTRSSLPTMVKNLLVINDIGFDLEETGALVERNPRLIGLDTRNGFRPTVDSLSRLIGRDRLKQFISRYPTAPGYRPCRIHLIRSFLSPYVGPGHVGDVLYRNPPLLGSDISKTLKPRADYLTGLAGSRQMAGRMIKKSPRLLTTDTKKTQARVDYLASIGLGVADARRVMIAYPSILGLDIGKMEDRERYLRGVGIESDGLLNLIVRCPQVLGLDVGGTLKPKVEYLTGVMGFPPQTVVDAPLILTYSLEGRTKPRYLFCRRQGIGPTVSLWHMLIPSDEDFAVKFAKSTFEEYQAFKSSVPLSSSEIVEDEGDED